MGKIYMTACMKGGCAKTVTTYNLAYSLQKLGKKVLAVDFDSQANLTTCFGVEDPAAVPVTIGHLMMAQIEDEELPAAEEYIMSRNGVDFIPSSMVLSVVDAKLRLEMGAEKMLSGILESLRDRYDAIIIDTAPTLGALNINALAAADEVIITVNPQLLAMMGLQDFLKTVKKIKSRINDNDIIRELQILSGADPDDTCCHNGNKLKSLDVIASEYGFSSRNAARYLRLNHLIQPFKNLMDENKIA